MSSGVEVTSSCLCVGQAFSQGKGLCCHTNPLSVQAPRARAGAAAFGAAPAGRRVGGGERWEATRHGSGSGQFPRLLTASGALSQSLSY